MRRIAQRAALAAVALIGVYTIAFGEAPPAATHFSHADHASRKIVGGIDKCDGCHGVDARGRVVAPAAVGHAPCLSGGCHATYFLATSAAARTADPKAYARATAFCLGCHDSKTGGPPPPFEKPATRVLQSFQYEREYHVEMNHFEHAQRAECRQCHVVDDKTFALVKSAPGHAQCVQCHNPQKFPQFTMAMCNLCHDKPSRAEYFKGNRPDIDVRACDGEGHAAIEAKLGRKVSCFRHERPEHRTAPGAGAAGGSALQCNACHYMIDDKTKWERRRYQTLLDLHQQTIIDNNQDRQHKSCGQSTACHQRDVDAARPGARCSLCHAEKSAF